MIIRQENTYSRQCLYPVATRGLHRPSNVPFEQSCVFLGVKATAKTASRSLLWNDDVVPHGELDEFRRGLQLQVFHDPIFVKRDGSSGHVQNIRCFLH
jgi:hypothetical protein